MATPSIPDTNGLSARLNPEPTTRSAMSAETITVSRPARAELVIDLGAIERNVSVLSQIASGSGAETMVVVKADAYGHGLVPVAEAALTAGATWLGTCDLASAFELRQAGISARLFSWLDTFDADFARAVTENIDLSISSIYELSTIARAARRTGLTAHVHLKIDTGLWRNGCGPGEWSDLVAAAAAEPAVNVVAIWSHLACADEPGHPATDLQARRFDEAFDIARAAGLRPKRHIANSAATLTRPDLHFDLVRTGIAVYGYNPVPGTADLEPAMTFRSSVVHTKRVSAGESVSYGHTWTAPDDTILALVPVGYADGVPRGLSGRLAVWTDGAMRPVVGRICMDQLIVDCGRHRPDIGTSVVLFGTQDGVPTARAWAEALGTIDDEIVSGMPRSRTRRVYSTRATERRSGLTAS